MPKKNKPVKARRENPLELGRIVRPYGKLIAVALISQERYYFFVDRHRTVSFFPATMFEQKTLPHRGGK